MRDLVDFVGNPQEQNNWSLPTLIKSLAKYNVVETPVIDMDNTLLSGHGRKKALAAAHRTAHIDRRLRCWFRGRAGKVPRVLPGTAACAFGCNTPAAASRRRE